MDKFDLQKYRGALGDAVLRMKPVERQSFQMTEVGRQIRYEFGEPEYHYLNCILTFLPGCLVVCLPVTYLPSSVFTRSLFPPQEEASFAFLVPRAKFCLLLLACVI